MRGLTKVLLRLRSLFRRRAADRELDSELRFHVEKQFAANVAAGMPPTEARRQALIEFGGVEELKEECRDMRKINWLQDFAQDVRFGLRMLRKSPGFTAIAILTLALGIGANTAIFSAVYGILLKPLPYPDSARLVELKGDTVTPDGFHFLGLSLAQIRDIQTQCPGLSQVAYYSASGEDLLGANFPDSVMAASVSGNFFTLLGIRPLLGRPILPSDAKPGNDRVIVLNFDLWKDDFGGDPAVVGKTITLDQKPYMVIGVMPPQFKFATYGRKRALWQPLPGPHDYGNYAAVARLQGGVTLAAANAQFRTLAARLASAHPATDKALELLGQSVKATMIEGVRIELWILFSAVAFVLLTACANLSGMLLSRSFVRRKEVAIRAAMGATRLRIVRQLLTESLILSFAGGALGLLLAIWAIPILRAIAPADTPRIENLRLDANLLWFTLLISLVAGIIFGLAPAIQVSHHRRGTALSWRFAGELASSSARSPLGFRNVLIALEVAIAVILVTGAALMARSLQEMIRVPLGYKTDHILAVSAGLAGSACDWQHPEPCRLAVAEILRRISGLPGVESASVTASAPLLYGGYGMCCFEVEGPSGLRTWNSGARFNEAAPGYFHMMGISLLAGRDFNNSDSNNAHHVAIVNRTFAQRYLFSGNPLGQRISIGKDKNGQPEWMEIVAEIIDIHEGAVTHPVPPEFYMPEAQANRLAGAPNFVVRTKVDPSTLAAAVRQQIWSVDKDAPVGAEKTMNQIIAESEAEPRFQTLLLASFAFLGLLLATVGTYALISYNVTQRTHEIGIRIALGAGRGDVLRMVLREGLLLAFIGIAIGVTGALALTRFLRSLLFEIKPTDPATFIGVAILLAFVALAACYIPARRAMRVDPMVALRYE